MSESNEDLQKQLLDILYDYCDVRKLKVNVQKSKIVVLAAVVECLLTDSLLLVEML